MLAQSRNVQAAFKQKQSVSLLGSLCQLFCHFTSFRCIQELDSISLVKNELNMMAGPAKQNSPRAPKSKLHKTYKMCLDPGKPKTLNKGPARDPPRPSFWVKAYYMPSEFLTGSLLPKGSRNFRFPFKSCNFHWRWPLKTATFGGSKNGNGSETLPYNLVNLRQPHPHPVLEFNRQSTRLTSPDLAMVFWGACHSPRTVTS